MRRNGQSEGHCGSGGGLKWKQFFQTAVADEVCSGPAAIQFNAKKALAMQNTPAGRAGISIRTAATEVMNFP